LKPAGDMGVAMDNIAGALINQGELTGPLVDKYKNLQESAENLRSQMIGLELDSPEFKDLDKRLEFRAIWWIWRVRWGQPLLSRKVSLVFWS